jgi:hypothetical protein
VNQEFIDDHLALIALAESCYRKVRPSYSWHVFDWMAWRLRCKYPPIMRRDQILAETAGST